jgi:hypothetical protein
MESFLVSLGFGVWQAVEKGYNQPTNCMKSNDEIKDYENNEKERNAIFSGLSNSELGKVISLKYTKDV